jgi:GntR family transcriptional regulator
VGGSVQVRSGAAAQPRVPKYQRVRDALRGEIANATSGTLIPSEHELCAEHQVSRITVRRAIDELIQEGLLVRLHGRGTIVADGTHPRPELMDLRGFHRQMSDEGHRVSSRVLAQGIVVAPAEVSTALDLRAGAPVVRLDRLRSVDGTVDHLTREWLDAGEFADVVAEDFTAHSLFAYLGEHHDLTLTRSDVAVFVSRATGDEASLLHIEEGQERLSTRSTTFDDAGRPRLHGRNLYAAESALMRFTVTSPYPTR